MRQDDPMLQDQSSGWDEAFDRLDSNKRGPEKPQHVLNARQLEYIAHIKRMQKSEADNVGRGL